MTDYFLSKGILHHRSCVETPQQNGIVERKHQHILNVARALTFQSHLPSNLWHLAIQQAIHIINRLPTPLLNHKSPYELLHSTPPTLTHLRVFGCLAFSSTLQNQRTKFQPRARKSVFLGYRDGTKGYLLYDLATNEFYVSRNVVFHETTFPFSTTPNTEPVHPTTTSQDIFDLPYDPPTHFSSNLPIHIPATLPPANSQPNSPPPIQSPTPIQTQTTTNVPVPVRKSTRIVQPPKYLSDYNCNLLSSELPASSTGNSNYPLSSVLSYAHCSPAHKHFCLAITSVAESKTYTQVGK